MKYTMWKKKSGGIINVLIVEGIDRDFIFLEDRALSFIFEKKKKITYHNNDDIYWEKKIINKKNRRRHQEK